MATGRLFVKLREALNDPEKLLRRLGAMGVGASQQAFELQRLGSDPWPRLYPSQSEPFISIAGALEDFNSGRSAPRANRFDSQPSMGTGARKEIFDSLSWDVVSNKDVEIGSVHPFATSAQFGSQAGDEFTPVTELAKQGIRKWLFKKIGSTWGPLSGPEAVRQGREGYVPKLSFLLGIDQYTQSSLPRPFLGITDEFANDVHRAVEDYFQEKADA